jgi:hypothetical protein
MEATIAEQLKPLRQKLEELKKTTPENLPEYHPDVHAASEAELVKKRLCSIMEDVHPLMIDNAPEAQRDLIRTRIL